MLCSAVLGSAFQALQLHTACIVITAWLYSLPDLTEFVAAFTWMLDPLLRRQWMQTHSQRQSHPTTASTASMCSWSNILVGTVILPLRSRHFHNQVLAKYSQPPFPSGLQMDLVLCAIVAKGNDYLPALRGAGGPVNSLVLWKQYLKLRRSPQWCHE